MTFYYWSNIYAYVDRIAEDLAADIRRFPVHLGNGAHDLFLGEGTSLEVLCVLVAHEHDHFTFVRQPATTGPPHDLV